MVEQMKISKYWQTLHQQKILKTFTCLLSLNYLVWRPASWKKPCLGLRFQSVIFTGWPTKSDRFFSLLFYFIHATFCLLVIYGWLVLSVLFMNSFDFLFLSFPDSLEYIVCQHWKPLPNHMYFQTDFKVFKMNFQHLNTILLYFNPVWQRNLNFRPCLKYILSVVKVAP